MEPRCGISSHTKNRLFIFFRQGRTCGFKPKFVCLMHSEAKQMGTSKFGAQYATGDRSPVAYWAPNFEVPICLASLCIRHTNLGLKPQVRPCLKKMNNLFFVWELMPHLGSISIHPDMEPNSQQCHIEFTVSFNNPNSD